MHTYDFMAHLIRQIVFSRATFGPGARTDGVLDHITKEIVEVRNSNGDPSEWVDLVILSLDGLTRSIGSNGAIDFNADEIAAHAIQMIRQKQAKNERRNWPDWRSAEPGKAIEHERGHHD